MHLWISLHTILRSFLGTLPLIFGAGATVGVVVGEGVGACKMLVLRSLALQTYGEPSGLRASSLGRLIYSSLPRIKLEPKTLPSLSCPIRMLNQEKQPSGTGGVANFEIKLVRLHWKPSPLQGKKQQVHKKLSQPHLAFLQEQRQELVWFCLSPPIQLPGSSVLVATFGFLIYHEVSPIH